MRFMDFIFYPFPSSIIKKYYFYKVHKLTLRNNISKHELRMNNTSTAFIILNVNFSIY